ncbi:MAG: hypothetical protein LBO69_00540 [Ignavibacteria bacterium]|jgi:hypothetical protein|nr:hypothetical protein [Ignavibacteria bacterium]
MPIDAILLLILKITGTAFLVFLAGFSCFRIVTYSKRKQLKRQQRQELDDAHFYEKYINSLDDNLRNEIDDAVADFNRKNNTTLTKEHLNDFYTDNPDKYDYSELKANLHKILHKSKKAHKWIEKGVKTIEFGEELFRKFNPSDVEIAKFEQEKQKAINATRQLLNFLGK